MTRQCRAALKKFKDCQAADQLLNVPVSLLNSSQLCYDFDVSSQPVSVHLPLSRMISGLLLAVPKYEIPWDNVGMALDTKSTVLHLMEAPLRLQVLIAQVNNCIHSFLIESFFRFQKPNFYNNNYFSNFICH